ncbi:hypothetical protein AHF37_07734 [Paragonimus kellicotti]|nr:hypothetical protein AHF37_07734 [Paragonimus kellicotti]
MRTLLEIHVSLTIFSGVSVPAFHRETPQADQSSAVEITTATTRPSSERDDATELMDRDMAVTNQVVVGDGWLNFTATRSSTMRMVFFCQAENYLGRARSRKMVVHQGKPILPVPMPDENLRIVYTTFPIEPGQKAVVTCQPEQAIFNRFLKVKYWEVYLNGTLISTIDRSSMIVRANVTALKQETPQADQSSAVEITTATTRPSSERDDATELMDRDMAVTNQVVVGDGWLNFTATRSSTMRMVFFCQAENYLGRARSRKMVVHQGKPILPVPMPDENLRIVYTTFPIEPGQKAVVTCQPEQAIFNRFLKVKYWEVYLNGTLISTIDRSFGRFSMINVTKHPELHIRSVTEAELAGLEVRCVLQSIVDEFVKVERPERGRLQRLQFGFSYTELRSVGTEVNVLRGSTVELPWAIEGELRVGVDWFYLSDTSRTRQAIALPSSSSPGADASSSMDRSPSGTHPVGRKARFLPWGTEYELVDGAHGNLRLINLSVADSGHYIAESANTARSLRVKYMVRVRGAYATPLGVKVTPSQRMVDWGSHVELTCEVTGHPRQLVYWLHNSRAVPKRHRVLNVGLHLPSASTSFSSSTRGPPQPLSIRLVIEAFTLDDVGVYQCIAENGHSTERLALGMVHTPTDVAQVSTILPINMDRVTETMEGQGEELTSSSSTSLTGGEVVGDLIDNAQATTLLTMGRMRPALTWQNPAVEDGSTAAQVLLSIHSGITDVTLECRFAANPGPQIIWYRDDQPVPLDESGVISPEVSVDKSTAYTTITRLTIDIRKVINRFAVFFVTVIFVFDS